MNGPRAADLVFAALSYAIDRAAAEDAHGLHEIGLDRDAAARLRALTLEDLRRVGSLCGNGLDFKFDGDVLRTVLDRLTAAQRDEALQRVLVRADAPWAMMRSLFGMESREYTALRKRLGVGSGVGRPADLDDAAEHRLWHALVYRLQSDPDRPLEPAQFLDVEQETGLPLRAIWNRARLWARQDADRNGAGFADQQSRSHGKGD